MPDLTMSPAGRKYGFVPPTSPPPTEPHRWYQMPPEHVEAVMLPKQFDLGPKFASIPIYDQGSLGSCVAQAWAAVVAFIRQKEHLPNQWAPSRLAIYYDARRVLGNTTTDSGSTVSAASATLTYQGVFAEPFWPYDPTKVLVEPPPSYYAAAKPHRIVNPLLIDNTKINVLKSCLASGFPFVAGFLCYASFEYPTTIQTGIVPMPNVASEAFLGGHAVCVTSYSDATRMFGFRQSWGLSYGAGGRGWLPYDYLTSIGFSRDFHMARASS